VTAPKSLHQENSAPKIVVREGNWTKFTTAPRGHKLLGTFGFWNSLARPNGHGLNV